MKVVHVCHIHTMMSPKDLFLYIHVSIYMNQTRYTNMITICRLSQHESLISLIIE